MSIEEGMRNVAIAWEIALGHSYQNQRKIFLVG